MALPALCEQLRSVCVVQAPPICNTSASATREDLSSLLRLGEQVSQQHMECHTAVEAGEESTLDLVPEEKLIETTKELEREIEKARTSCYNKTLVLQRIQMANALLSGLKENDNEPKVILEVIKHGLMLCSSILKSQQEARVLEDQLCEIRKKRLTLKKLGGEKLLQLQSMKKKQKEDLNDKETEKLKRIRIILEKEIRMTTLVQSVFQNIIIGSRVNWAEDPQLKAIFLKLEKNADSL
ncbi:centromere protein H [Microcaecilia unicolor]|uniref:Centromere protein H n=1 Tax=Microcaecilia unicolor TaxID=1415580 RepID=A0A6P7XC31_9AMPH|nr:centromere protein H [Microcaecilia unicolor]